jgi:hypothetical protein
LQWNHTFNENKVWFDRAKFWLTNWSKKPQVYVREEEKTDDDAGDTTVDPDATGDQEATDDL